jgi:RNA polymerase sigma-70 factor (ECF subfamily)
MAQRPAELAADLLLARACLQGDPRALRDFEARHFPEVADFIARVDPTPAFAEEVRQTLRDELFVAKGTKPPKIASYSGRGPLGAWLRLVAVRVALTLKRRERSVPLMAEPASAAPDPELDFLKAKYREEFKRAFQSTLEGLTADERNVLRLHYLDGLPIESVAALLGVHRATVHRWMARSRQNLLAATRKQLAERLGLDSAEVASVLRLIQSRLDLSMSRLLGGDATVSGPVASEDESS